LQFLLVKAEIWFYRLYLFYSCRLAVSNIYQKYFHYILYFFLNTAPYARKPLNLFLKKFDALL